MGEEAGGGDSNATDRDIHHREFLRLIAWYGHPLYPNVPLWQAIFVSWIIALFEYMVAVPANRLGYFQYGYTPA